MIEGSMYSVFLGLLSGRAGPKLQPQASNPEQHNNTTTRRLYGVNVGDGEKDTIVRGFWHRICGLFAEQIRKRWLYLIRL